MINPSTQLKGSSSPFRTIEKQILNNKSSILFKKKRKTFFKFNFKKTNRETKPFFSAIFNSLSSDLCWTCYLVLIFAFTWLMVLKTFGPYWVIVSLGRSLCILFQIFSSIFLFAQFDGPRHSVLSFMPVGSLSIGSLAVLLSEWFHQIQSFHFIIIKKKHKKKWRQRSTILHQMWAIRMHGRQVKIRTCRLIYTDKYPLWIPFMRSNNLERMKKLVLQDLRIKL